MHRDKESKLIKDILLVKQKELSGGGDQFLPRSLDISWESSEREGRQFYYINNPTGTIRWFFPADSRYPAYLALYNSAHWKAKLYKLGTFAAFSVGLQKKLTSGQFLVHGTELTPLEEMLGRIPFDTYGIFTGTVGENRKSIIALAQNQQLTHFAKLAHSPKGEMLLQNEHRTLSTLLELKREVLDIPTVSSFESSNLLLLSNIKPKNGRETAKFGELHVRALEEYYRALGERKILGDLKWYKDMRARVEEINIETIADPSLNQVQLTEILNNLKRILVELDPDMSIPVALAHGDFTSWNMYVSEKNLHVYDWELAKPEMPLLYDLFHFIYQTGILLLKQPYPQIKTELKRAFRLPASQALAHSFSLDIELMHKLYLLDLVSYYLHIYVREPQVHMQVHWLVDTWDQALKHILTQ